MITTLKDAICELLERIAGYSDASNAIAICRNELDIAQAFYWEREGLMPGSNYGVNPIIVKGFEKYKKASLSSVEAYRHLRELIGILDSLLVEEVNQRKNMEAILRLSALSHTAKIYAATERQLGGEYLDKA